MSLGQPVRIESAAGAEPEKGTVISAPAAVDPASATADVRIKFSAPTHLAAGQPVSVTIVADRLTNVIVIPTVAIIRDGDEIFVMVAGEDDDKAHKTPVTLGASANGMTRGEDRRQGRQPRDRPRPGGPAGRGGHHGHQMNPARVATRNSRAVLLLTLFLTVAGAIASVSLPSSIYPPLQFPRVVVIAHAGTTPAPSMTLTVARPIEQAIMEVPGIRRVRSRTFRGASEISAQFEPATDMVVALQQVQGHVAEIRGALPAETELTVERLTPAAFPIYSLNLVGGLTAAELNDIGFYDIRPALSRVPGVGKVEVLSSDTREIEVIVDPGKMRAANLTIDDVVGGAQERESADAGRPVHRQRPAASRARLRPLGVGRRHRAHANRGQGRARRCACRTSRR